MNYSLTLAGSFDTTKNRSVEFFTRELTKEFEKYPHIHLHKVDANFDKLVPTTDIGLIHAYFGCSMYRHMKFGHNACFMESPHSDMDCNYIYTNNYTDSGKDFKGKIVTVVTGIPVVKSLYNFVPKKKGSILLDHDIQGFPGFGNPSRDLNETLWTFFKSNKRDVSGLHRTYLPAHIKPIANQTYEKYLKATETFETFIVTHKGSFNHTVVDMAARGTRVIAPRGFVPIDNLGIEFIDSLEELYNLLEKDVVFCEPKIDKCTDLCDIVQQMDIDFKSVLSGTP